MLLEPETRYQVINVEENKKGFEGITWVTLEVIDSSPVIKGLIKRVETVKEGKNKVVKFHFTLVSYFLLFLLLFFTEKMKSAEWLAEQINLSIPYSEPCSFYLDKLSIACSSSSPNCTLNDFIPYTSIFVYSS